MEGFDGQGYRAAGKVDGLRSTQDPIRIFVDKTGLSEQETSEVDVTVEAAVELAVATAKAAPTPDESELPPPQLPGATRADLTAALATAVASPKAA
jgi:TPP-dependent pyruvate/acetoin dehydrogenase alpha subunit